MSILLNQALKDKSANPTRVYGRYPTLRANLVLCSNLGREAFENADKKMTRLRGVSLRICRPNGIVCLHESA
jgi:hypothetical protein